jgi:hypothetical protein
VRLWPALGAVLALATIPLGTETSSLAQLGTLVGGLGLCLALEGEPVPAPAPAD